ncbi:MAG: TIGR01459 family HAD-type hydrolase [Gammaproteobacteria bacterium]|nr:TIGR01459 family HAD-type hydrolase [Gammaproteobacteria bacterium]
MKQISGLEQIHPTYDAFLVDAWGVLHDGVACYPGAKNCLQRLAEFEKPVIVMSNAARRQHDMELELSRVGVNAALYRSVISSGELTWRALREGRLGLHLVEPGYYLGPQRSVSICDGLPLAWTDSVNRAGFVLNAGAPSGNPRDTELLVPLLEAMVARRLPMICANPDQVAVRAGELGISAGAIARRYQDLGATRIIYCGKPFHDIFEVALAALPGIDKSRILMVGDAFETDIAGALAFGLDSLLIAGGIHSAELDPLNEASLRELAARYGVKPGYYCEFLGW